jgi:hypothetical protein
MRTLKFVMLIPLIFCACGKSDNEVVIGEWRFSKMVANGELVVSDDSSEQQKIVENALNDMRDQLKEMNQSEEEYTRKLKRDMALMLGVTFQFTQDSTVFIKSNTVKSSKRTTWRYRMEEPKKQLIIYEPERTVIYSYSLHDNLLTLSDQKDSIVLRR